MSYCCGQENGGVIVNVKSWGGRRWEQTVRVTLEEIGRKCDLWSWDGNDLVVMFYPIDKEREVRAKRAAALATNKMKQKRPAERIAERGGERSAQRHAEPSFPPPSSLREDGGAGQGEMPPSSPQTVGLNHPDLAYCLSHFQELAHITNGLKPYTDEEVKAAFLSFEAGKDTSGNWRWGKSLVGDWRAAIESRIGDHRLKHPPKPKCNLTPAERGLYTGPG